MSADKYKQFDGKSRTVALHKDKLITLGTDSMAQNMKHLKSFQDQGPRAAAVLKKLMTMMVFLNHTQEDATRIINGRK